MRPVLHRRWKGLLDLDDRQRRHHLDEAEEEQKEPGEAADDDHRVGRARIVDAPRVGVEVVPERRDDDVEPLEPRSEEHTSELQSHSDLVCRLLLEKKNNNNNKTIRVRYNNKKLH